MQNKLLDLSMKHAVFIMQYSIMYSICNVVVKL